MATQTDNLVVYNSGKIQKVGSSDVISVSGDITIGGNLTVNGTTTTVNTEIVTSDPYILMNSDTTGSSMSNGGLVMLNGTDSVVTSACSAFTNSTDTITVSDSSNFTVGDIVVVQGSTSNDGLYEVGSIPAGGVSLTIDPSPSGSLEGIVLSSLVDETGASANVRKATISVFRSDAVSSTWEYGKGSTNSISYTDLGSGGASTLQEAYNGGQSIQLSNGNALDVNVPSSGNAAITLDANAASNFSVAGDSLTLSTTTSGDIVINSAGTVDIDGAIDIDASGSETIAINSVSGAITTTSSSGNISSIATDGEVILTATGSSGVVDINGTSVDIDAGATGFHLDGTGNSNVSVAGANLTLSTTSGGNVVLNSNALLDVDSATLNIDTTGAADINFGASSTIDSADNLTIKALDVMQIESEEQIQIKTTFGNTDLNSKIQIYNGGVSGTNPPISIYNNRRSVQGQPISISSPHSWGMPTAIYWNDEGHGPKITAGATTDLGQVCGIDTDGRMVPASASATVGNGTTNNVIGVLHSRNVSDGTSGAYHAVPGQCWIQMDSAPSSSDIGSPLYLSTTTGKATLTAPTASGTRVWRLGYLNRTVAATGSPVDSNSQALTLYRMVWSLQYIIDNP